MLEMDETHLKFSPKVIRDKIKAKLKPDFFPFLVEKWIML